MKNILRISIIDRSMIHSSEPIIEELYSSYCNHYADCYRTIGTKETYYFGHINKKTHKNLYLNHKINPDEFNKAIKIISTYMMQNSDVHSIELNLDDKNEELAPVKQMTLEEIEKELGYKVKIINK